MYVSRARMGAFLVASLFYIFASLFMLKLTKPNVKIIYKERTTVTLETPKDALRTRQANNYNKISVIQDARILTKSRISKVAEIFPIDSSPPITLYRGFLIENAGLCSSFLSLTYVVVVHSAPNHFERRQSFRDSWAKVGALKNVNSRTIFVLGRCRNKTIQASIEKENESNKDIVQGDFYDHYRNLTLKAVMGLKWVVKNCPNAEYMIKVDDDVFVNIFQVNRTIFPILAANEKQVVCSAEPRPRIFRLNNPTKSLDKWKVSGKYFKNLGVYPMPFCFGYATFYTTSLAADLLKTAASTPFFRLDDIYVYGILVSKTKGATWRNEGRRYIKDEKQMAAVYLKRKDFLVGTVRTAQNMRRMWETLKAQQK